MTVEFEATWPGIELEDYRSCGGTYEYYPYSSVPPLNAARFTGAFDWIADHGAVDPVRVAFFADLDRQLSEVGLALPPDFVHYHTHTTLALTMVDASVTCCGSTLLSPTHKDDEETMLRFRDYPIPSPVEPGTFLIRFLNDQQDCVTWYLYLRPGGETFVVHAYGLEFDVDDEETPAYLRPGVYPIYLEPCEYEGFAKLYWCAPSFEQFAYRFWIENTIADAFFSDPKKDLTEDQIAYLDHYRRASEAS